MNGKVLLGPKANFSDEISLRGANINLSLATKESQFDGKFEADRLRIGGSLLLRSSTFDGVVDLQNAKVGANFRTGESIFNKPLSGEGLRTGGTIYLNNKAEFHDVVDLGGAKIQGNLDLGTGKFHGSVKLVAGEVKGILKLGDETSGCPKWSPGSKLILRAASVRGIQDRSCSWDGLKGGLDLQGLEYEHLLPVNEEFYENGAGDSNGKRRPGVGRSREWLLKWVGKSNELSLQPYEELADTLRRYGDYDKADEIMIAANDLLRSHASTPSISKAFL